MMEKYHNDESAPSYFYFSGPVNELVNGSQASQHPLHSHQFHPVSSLPAFFPLLLVQPGTEYQRVAPKVDLSPKAQLTSGVPALLLRPSSSQAYCGFSEVDKLLRPSR
jgi:hypothetical protein